MKYQAYPEYKPSGIGSTPRIPTHWVPGKVKFVTSSLDKIRIPLSAEERGKRKGEYPYYGASGIIDYIDDYLFDEETILFGEDGANLIARSSPLAFLAKEKYWVNNHAHILKTKDGVNDYWVMCLENIDVTTVVSGSAQPKLTAEALGDLQVVYPPTILEREKIASFLDHETAKIDTLIEKQQQLIKLLKEKRQAVISHAVTKGLNPDAPMRDSGVEWLGEVPKHWERMTFKYVLELMVDNRGRTPPTYDTGIPLLEAKQIDGNLKYASGDFDKFIDEVGHKGFIRDDVQEDDILFITVGTIGKTCLVSSSPEFVIAQNIVALRTTECCNPLFLLFWLRSLVARESMLSTNKDSILDSIKISDFVQSRLYIPPVEEQEEIANFLDQEIVKIDSLVQKADAVIDLMQERRTVLIYAAVTGKIDVR